MNSHSEETAPLVQDVRRASAGSKDEGRSDDVSFVKKIRRTLTTDSQRLRLYCSYGLSSWGDRMWTFANSLALVCIGGNLQLAAIGGLVSGAVCLTFGSWVGRWIDKTGRLKAGLVSLTLNNLFVAASAAFYLSVLYYGERVDSVAGLRTTFLVLGVALMALGALAQVAFNITTSKDWAVVISRGDRDALASLNATLLRIDLSAMIISPLIAGQLIASLGMIAGCLFVACWHVGSYVVESLTLYSLYRSVPELAHKKQMKRERRSTISWMAENLEGWKLYFTQPIMPAGLALNLLFMTVLGLDGITTGFVYDQGVKENILAALRGVGALVGIFGSLAYPVMRRRVGLERTGLFSLGAQLAALSLCVASIWAPGSPFDPVNYFNGNLASNRADDALSIMVNASTISSHAPQTCNNQQQYKETSSQASVWLFLAGVVLARFGLWAADLTINQIYQEYVDEEDRGKVNGVQASLNKTMDLVKNVLVIVLPNDATFGILIILSFGAVSSGFLSFCVYSRRVRGHLFPFHKRRVTNYSQIDAFDDLLK